MSRFSWCLHGSSNDVRHIRTALLELSRTGGWDTWVTFFAEGVASSASDSRAKVEGLLALQAEFRRVVQKAGKRGSAERLAADLVGMPYVTAPQLAADYGLSSQGAMNAIKTLMDLSLLQVASFRLSRGTQVYVAPAVVEALT